MDVLFPCIIYNVCCHEVVRSFGPYLSLIFQGTRQLPDGTAAGINPLPTCHIVHEYDSVVVLFPSFSQRSKVFWHISNAPQVSVCKPAEGSGCQAGCQNMPRSRLM